MLASVRAETLPHDNGKACAFLLAVLAIVSVAWWRMTGAQGIGDLRPYLLLQALPLLLIPMWQAIYRAPRQDRIAYGAAIASYVCAKFAEINDHAIHALSGFISGHTLKHLLAALAAGIIVQNLIQRTSTQADSVRLPRNMLPKMR